MSTPGEIIEKASARIEELIGMCNDATAERDALRVQLADLRAALQGKDTELAHALANYDGCEINPCNYNDCAVNSLNAAYVGLLQSIEEAMKISAGTPAESLARIERRVRVEVLEEARRRMHRDQTWCQMADMLTDMAEAARIASGGEGGR